ncbi:MAG: acyl--CoA ligase [Rhodospirillales bacterium]|nr:acyl--CoA ligase [Rhodospirillales bacterium]
MSTINIIFDRIAGFADQPAVYWRGQILSYQNLGGLIEDWCPHLSKRGIGSGTVCALIGDYSPGTCSLILALMKAGAIILPINSGNEAEMEFQLAASGAQHLFRFADDDSWDARPLDNAKPPQLVKSFLKTGHGGLIVFTSGSTGEPKGILHDLDRVAIKFIEKRKAWRTVMFLMFDHFGGFNTLLGVFAYGGLAVCLENRSVQNVCEVIENSQATLLPTTPTFLNFLLGSSSVSKYDLSSIERISYGTEVMPEETLKKINQRFANVKIRNTYGLSELGVLRTKSKSDGSTWVRVGGEGFETKVVDGMLWVRSQSRMVGYLNDPTPFDEDDWMCTNDRVEVNGDHIRILGRDSNMINVGGQKVSPEEVESIILEYPNVFDATVYGISNPLLGEVVVSDVSLHEPEDHELLTERLRALCLQNLNRYKVPARFRIIDKADHHNLRFKKSRVRPSS